jgi:primosomal protein N' (replication factor Y)
MPVAVVAADVSLPHLDRPFEYLVPASLADAAVPGCRVRVRFAGRLTSGYLLERTAESQHEGKLGYLERVVSPEPVLTPEIAGLARAVADRYGGTLADVLRLAIPPRHGQERHGPRMHRLRTRRPGTRRPAASRRRPDRGPGTRPDRSSWPPWPTAARRGRSGRRCPEPAGRRRSRWPPPPWPPPGAAR